MSLGTSNRDGGKTSESGHLRALAKIVSGDIITGLNAVQRAAGVNMSVDVQVGDAFVRRSDGSYAHPVFNDAVYNQVISAADGSNPRRDIVVLYVDYNQAPSTAVSNNTNGVVKIKVVNGTPAGSPTDPNDAAIQSSVGSGNPWTKLARVRVPAGQTSISNSLIDDLRTMITNNASTVNKAALQSAVVDNTKVDFSTTGKVWWEELGRIDLASPAASLVISSLPVRKYLKVLFYTPSGTNLGFLFNNDSGGNYVFKYTTNTGQSGVTGNAILGTMGGGSNGTFGEMEIINIASAKKIGHLRATWAGANASTAGDDSNFYFTWHNSTDAITSITFKPTSGNLGTGAQIIVLGHD